MPVQACGTLQGLTRFAHKEVAAVEVDVAGPKNDSHRIHNPGMLGNVAEPRMACVVHRVAPWPILISATLETLQCLGGFSKVQAQDREEEALPLVPDVSSADFAMQRWNSHAFNTHCR
eukprot:CAMPEP_0171084298 /NCGR_PEP_ID=MMETSP0766_2-20121228/18229_1 /TAXON_ID=439317 /ORGANISM="Gambierdiscus australes, Strain CAWD 149" /LENGTH=117 /DNA_ID=CAMNT_0011541789 /DNA_START=700 /DNA_END=1050 /DNA_ORIENTATION=+